MSGLITGNQKHGKNVVVRTYVDILAKSKVDENMLTIIEFTYTIIYTAAL